MQGSTTTSIFNEVEDFRAAMHERGVGNLLVTQRGRFKAWLTQVTLGGVSLLAVKESLPSTAFIRVPDDQVLILFWIDGQQPPIWGGTIMDRNILVVIAAGQSVHMRTDGPCHWGGVWLSLGDLDRYGHAVTGERLTLPATIGSWLPPHAANRQLRSLHAIAIRAAHARSDALTAPEAMAGLEQQLIHTLIDNLSGRPASIDTAMQRRRHELMNRFEELLMTEPGGDVGVSEISGALGVSDRLLRRCCSDRLGMSPHSYLKLRRLQCVYRDLRHPGPYRAQVSEVAERHGFGDLGRFAKAYRELFGELPSATLRLGEGGKYLPSQNAGRPGESGRGPD